MAAEVEALMLAQEERAAAEALATMEVLILAAEAAVIPGIWKWRFRRFGYCYNKILNAFCAFSLNNITINYEY